MDTISIAGGNSLSASSSGTHTIGSSACPKCGKPYTYVGDWFGGEPSWCTCAADEKRQAQAAFDAWKLVMEMPTKGWECPRCHSIYAPNVPKCWPCGNEAKEEFAKFAQSIDEDRLSDRPLLEQMAEEALAEHAAGNTLPMFPDIDPAVLAEIKIRALRIQDERSGRGKYKDLETHDANSILADLLLLIEALE